MTHRAVGAPAHLSYKGVPDEVARYPEALAAAGIQAHHQASGR